MDDPGRLASQEHHAPNDRIHATGSTPGIVVFSTALRLLYMNEEARRLCGTLNARRVGRTVHGVVPIEVFDLCDEGLKRLETRGEANEWEQFQLTRVAGDPECPILLRGFGLPDPSGFSLSRLLILMEAFSHKGDIGKTRLKDRFHLTYREQGVISYLIKGLTNKEIAVRMNVTEQTIKEHLRHIMLKTGTTTRAGLTSKIIFACPTQFSPDDSPSAGPA